MQPADTVRRSYHQDVLLFIRGPQTLTRVYNQPTVKGLDGRIVGTLYKSPIDCLWKTFKAEGIRGWYKGSFITSEISAYN